MTTTTTTDARRPRAALRLPRRASALLLVALAALLPEPAAALSRGEAPWEEPTPLVLPLRREVTPVYNQGKLVSFKTSYSGVVRVGTPKPKEMRVVFDTGSGHIVIPSVFCLAEACGGKQLYKPSESETGEPVNIDGSAARQFLGDSVTIGFGKGEVKGSLARDVVCLGPAPEAGAGAGGNDTCITTGLVTANYMSDDPFRNFTFDGIVGLGLSSLAVSEHFSFLAGLANRENSKSSGQFAVFLAEGDDVEESDITFGGYRQEHLLEPLTWVPLAKPEFGYWMVDVVGVYVDDLRLDVCSDGPCVGIMDTGSSHLGFPGEHVDALTHLLIRPSGDLEDCRNAVAPTLRIELRGFNLTILPENYMRRLPLDPALLKDDAFDTNETGNDQNASAAAGNGTMVVNSSATGVNGTGDGSDPDDFITEMACTAKLMSIDLPQLGPHVFLLGEPALHRYYTVYDARELRAGLGLARRRKQEPEEPEDPEVSHDEIFLMQQMQGVRKKAGRRKKELEQIARGRAVRDIGTPESMHA
eukprot:CAMPEP_0171168714 /NCGR_PEP_ID=MMETSP0790-20130122/7848_1 /TAXON_ID=2925 /ORGANISM="Alexandrium catenella, Strain OF101" /LENGTH=528 /DNA_ID=CAMNT_0011633553 /DNA_START=68 /DNA_END=1652 /DNA_ORIENTATION=+